MQRIQKWQKVSSRQQREDDRAPTDSEPENNGGQEKTTRLNISGVAITLLPKHPHILNVFVFLSSAFRFWLKQFLFPNNFEWI